MSSLVGSFDAVHRKFGPIVKIRVLFVTVVVAFSPEFCIKSLAKTPHPSTFFDALAVLIGDNITTRNGASWKHRRMKLSHGFSANMMRSFSSWFSNSSSRLNEVLRTQCEKNGEVNFTKAVASANFDLVTGAGFGQEMGTQYGKNHHIFEAFTHLPTLFNHPLMSVLGTTGARLLKLINWRTISIIDEVLYKCIDDRLSGKTQTQEGREDFLDLLIGLDKSSPQFTRKELRDESFVLFSAAHETSSVALQWCMALLAKNPRIWTKLKDEVERACPNGRQVTLDDFKHLEYLDMVLSEALRMYPPAFALARLTTEDLSFEGNLIVPKDSVTLIPIVHLHNDPNAWDRPQEFNPELHFSKEAVKSRHPGQFIPFAFGDRACLGQSFFWAMARTILANIVQSFDHIELANETIPSYTINSGNIKPCEPIRIRFFSS